MFYLLSCTFVADYGEFLGYVACLKIPKKSLLNKLFDIFVIEITSSVRYRSGVKFFHSLTLAEIRTEKYEIGFY